MAPDRSEGSAPHFMAECFFITQRVIHTCLIPLGSVRPYCVSVCLPARLSVSPSIRPSESLSECLCHEQECILQSCLA
jgi:hypothetical protein